MRYVMKIPTLRTNTLFASALLGCFFIAATAQGQVPLTQLSTDTFTNTTSMHATEVEPDTFAVGNTIVSVFQAGRFTDGGSSDLGFATSIDGGATWTHGFLPGVTKYQGGGKYDRASDPSVAYDAKHKLWIIASLALLEAGGPHGAAVLTSSSTDGITWANPTKVAIAPASGFFDKSWIVCDNTSTSPFYGNCYVQWDDFSQFDLIRMSTSKNGGKTWGAAKSTADVASGNGGQPVVQPNGTVIVPIDDPFVSNVLAFKSTNGGASWGATVQVAPINNHAVAGGMRAEPLISADIDKSGKVYVVWADCSFRTACKSNDIVMSTSTNGTTWTAPVRIPIDAVSTTKDHFIPGIAVDPATSGSTAHLGLTYYFFPNTNCTSNCKLTVGFIASTNGGTTWTAAKILSAGMNPAWLPATTSGQMVGDFISTSFASGKAHGAFAVAKTKVGNTFNEAIFTSAAGLQDASDALQYTSKNDKPMPNAHSDHVRRTTPIVRQ